MNFTNEQKVYAISWAVTTGNYSESSRQYKKKFGGPIPDYRQIQRWHEKLVATGNLHENQIGQGRPVTASGDNICSEIEMIVDNKPGTSQRKMATQTGVSQSSIHRVLKKSEIKKWKPQMKQELKEADYEKRVTFCNFILAKIDEDLNFLKRLVFSDEANFHVNGHVNLHNSFFYGKENPGVIIPKLVNSPSIGVFAACGYSGIISVRTYRRTVNSDFFWRFYNKTYGHTSDTGET